MVSIHFSYVASLPNLRSVTIKCIDMDNNVTKTLTVDFAELGLTAKRIQYEGFNAVEVSTTEPYPGPRIIYRDDGILLFANIAGEQVKLAVEDDIAKKTAAQPTQPSTTTTTPPITSTSTPTTTTFNTFTDSYHNNACTGHNSTDINSATDNYTTCTHHTGNNSRKTQGVNTMYVAVATIAVVGVVVVAIMLKKR